MANSVDPDQTAPIGAVCSGSTLFDFIFNLSVMSGNNLQQTTSADDMFRCIFLGALRVKIDEPTYVSLALIVNAQTSLFTRVFGAGISKV